MIVYPLTAAWNYELILQLRLPDFQFQNKEHTIKWAGRVLQLRLPDFQF